MAEDLLQSPDEVQTSSGADEVVLSRRFAGDVNDRFRLYADGRLLVGDGTNEPALSAGDSLFAWRHFR